MESTLGHTYPWHATTETYRWHATTKTYRWDATTETAHGECSQAEELLNAIRLYKLSIDCLKYHKDSHFLGQQHRM